jgi:hypothetical protein
MNYKDIKTIAKLVNNMKSKDKETAIAAAEEILRLVPPAKSTYVEKAQVDLR